jgi:hypothetical protein
MDSSHAPSLLRTRWLWWTRSWGRSCSHRNRSTCVEQDESPAEKGIRWHLARAERSVRGEPHRDASRPVSQRAARPRRGRTEDPRRARRPPSQRRPLLRRREATRLRCAHSSPRSLRRYACISPERQCIPDRVERVAQRPSHPTRHHDQHRPATRAPIPPRQDRGRARCLVRLQRPLHRATTQAVPNDPQSAPRLPTSDPTRRATRRPHRRARRGRCCPKLDLNRRLYDS